MEKSIHKTKKTYGRPSLYNWTLPHLCTFFPPFPLIFTDSPKNILLLLGVWHALRCVSFPFSFILWWLLAIQTAGLVGCGHRFFSLEQHHKSILIVFPHFAFDLLREGMDDSYEWTEKLRGWSMLFLLHKEGYHIHAATTDEGMDTHLDRWMR